MSTVSQPDRQRETATLARGASINLVGSIGRSFLSGLTLFLLTRGLGAGRAGAFIEATALFAIVVSTGALGVHVGYIRSISRAIAVGLDPNRARRILVVGMVPVVALSVALAGVQWVAAVPIAELIGNGERVTEIAAYLRGLAPFLPFGSVLMVLLGATRAFESMTPTVAVDQLLKLGLQCLGVAVALTLGAAPWLLVLAWGIPVLLGAFGSLVWLRAMWSKWPASPLQQVDSEVAAQPAAARTFDLRQEIVDFWSFTLPRSVSNLFQITVQWFDVLLVGALLSPDAAAIYAVSTRLVSLGVAVAQALSTVSQPMLGRMLSLGDRNKVRHVFETSTAWQILLTWPQYIVVAIAAPVLLAVFGQEFASGSSVVVVLAVSAIVASGAGPVDMVLLMAGKSMWSLWNTGVALAANIVLNLVLIPRIGIVGAALAWGVSRVLTNAIPMVQSIVYLKLHPYGRTWIRAAALTLLPFAGIGAVIVGAGGIDTLRGAILYGLVGTIIFLPLTYASRESLDLEVIRQAVARRLRPSRRRRHDNVPAHAGAGDARGS